MPEKKASASDAAAASGAPAPSFEQSLEELEAVVKQLESNDLPLERALELFERGMQLRETCQKQLTEAETRVEILIRKGNGTQAVPFDPEEE